MFRTFAHPHIRTIVRDDLYRSRVHERNCSCGRLLGE